MGYPLDMQNSALSSGNAYRDFSIGNGRNKSKAQHLDDHGLSPNPPNPLAHAEPRRGIYSFTIDTPDMPDMRQSGIYFTQPLGICDVLSSDAHLKFTNDDRGRDTNDDRGRDTNDHRGRDTNDDRGRDTNDDWSRDTNDHRGRDTNDDWSRDTNDDRGSGAVDHMSGGSATDMVRHVSEPLDTHKRELSLSLDDILGALPHSPEAGRTGAILDERFAAVENIVDALDQQSRLALAAEILNFIKQVRESSM